MTKPFRVWNAFENYYSDISGLRWTNGNPFVETYRVNDHALMEALVEPWSGCYEKYPEEMYPLSPQPIYVGDIVEVIPANSTQIFWKAGRSFQGVVSLMEGQFWITDEDFPEYPLGFSSLNELDIVKIVGNINRQKAMADLGRR